MITLHAKMLAGMRSITNLAKIECALVQITSTDSCKAGNFHRGEIFFFIASSVGEYPELGKVTTSYKDSISKQRSWPQVVDDAWLCR